MHLLIIKKNLIIKAITNYSAGEYVLWSHEEPHSAANIGVKDRYTLQITGVANKL